MMRSSYLLTSLLIAAACGDDGNTAPPDAYVLTYNYNLSCLNVKPSPVPAMVHVTGWLFHITSPTDGGEIPSTSVAVESIDGTSTLATATTGQNGIFEVDITTGGTLTPVRLAFQPAGFAKQRWYGSRAPWRSIAPSDGDFGFVGAKPSRAVAIAGALGQVVDATKGTVEVWVSDCSGKPMPGVMVSMNEHPDAQWAMHTPVGAWVPGTQTVAPHRDMSEAVAATVNVEPGMKTITVTTTGGTTFEPVPFLVEAGSFNRVFVIPGYANVGPGF